MPFAPQNPQIPGTTKPLVCRQPRKNGKGKCNKPAHNTIEGNVELFGKLVPVKINVCDEHFDPLTTSDQHFQIREPDDEHS